VGLAVQAAELAEHHARVGMVAIDHVAGLPAVLHGPDEPGLDRATDVGFERVALDT